MKIRDPDKAFKMLKIRRKEYERLRCYIHRQRTCQCNLHCVGCYSRCNQATVDMAPMRQLTGEEWLKIFEEADDMGISFILLAGGEPMIWRDIIEAAGKHPNILFPVFTNGTFMDEQYFDLFERCRNLVPIMSIEGEKEIIYTPAGVQAYMIG